MAEYRNRTTGEVKTQGQWRKENPQISLPSVWNENVCDALNIDPVISGDKPTGATAYQVVVRDGVVQDSDGNWKEKFIIKDMFADTTEDGVTTTKAEHEAAYQQALDTQEAEVNRGSRNAMLSETDFYALSDVTMSTEMASYRQALRDITSHKNWPYIKPDDWPSKP